MALPDSAYKKFILMHRRFYDENPEPSDIDRRRPLRFIEEIGIECAVWPHLYWDVRLCETHARTLDDRRRQVNWKDGWNDEGESEAEDEDNEGYDTVGRTSIRKHFMRKVLSPVIGYSGDFQLLQFVYDLSLWTGIGAKKSRTADYGLEFRIAMKGCSFTPMYWRTRHLGVLDLQRQCGNPAFFQNASDL